jgi:hypothetical protein
MVYDEGFEITFGKKNTPEFQSYFVFLKYKLVNGNYKSKCYESMIGWYHLGYKNFGCFKGHKDVKNYTKFTNFEVANKFTVVEGGMFKSFLNIETKINPTYSPRFIQKENKHIYNNKNVEDILHKNEITKSIENINDIYNKNNSEDKNEVNFFEFENHLKNMNQIEMVEKINYMNLSWKAAEYEEFEGLSNEEIYMIMKNGNLRLTKKKSIIIIKLLNYQIYF